MSASAPLRVLVHLNSLELGGTQINAVDLAAQMRGRGVESILLGAAETLPDGPSLFDIAAARGERIEVYEPAPTLMKRARQLEALTRQHDAHLVHVYGSWGGGARPTYWGPARLGRTPWVQTVYEMTVSPKIHRHMPMIVGTGYQRDDESSRPGRTVLISPPVDMIQNSPECSGGAEFRAANLIGDEPLLVIVSRLDASMKSVPALAAIDAMRVLSATGATLAIVGTGDNVAAIRAMAESVNDEVGRRAIVMVGSMSDPRAAYAAADIMLGMGGSAARSLAFGKTLVVQGEAGWSLLFEPDSAESLARSSYWSPDEVSAAAERLADIILPLLDDPERRADLGRFGRTFAERRFSLPVMADQLIDFYRSSLGEYSRRDWLADLPNEGRRLTEKAARIGRGLLRGTRPRDGSGR